MELGMLLILVATGVVILFAIGVIVIVLIKHKNQQLNEKPRDDQFANREYRPGDGTIDVNRVKFGRVQTIGSFRHYGFISWNEYFHPTSAESRQKRMPATFAILGLFLIFFIFFVGFALLDMIWAMMFMLFLLAYLIFLILFKFIKIRVLKKLDK